VIRFRVQGSKVQGSGFRVQGSKVQRFKVVRKLQSLTYLPE
jgi:hypothetical protein